MEYANIPKKREKVNKIGFPAGTLLAPVPAVIVTCGTCNEQCALTIAWTGILASDPPKTYISVRKERHSYDVIKESGEFVINLVNKKLVFAADYCGIKSGRNVDKFKEMHFETSPAKFVKCPTIDQSPLNLECKVTDIVPLGSHDMFIADILGVNVDSQYIDNTGRICLDEAFLVSYCHGEYFLLGEKLGKFGYSTKPKKARK